jgi:hypothetical protein
MIRPDSPMPGISDLHPQVTLRRVSPDDGHYFFGYYDKCPWDPTGRFLLAHKVDFFDRQPRPHEEAGIGVIDLAGGLYRELDRTAGWSWQQGSMLQWLASDSGSAAEGDDGTTADIIYNQFDGRRYTAVMRDIHGGGSRVFDRPIYCVGPDGRQALSLDFERLHRLRPGYGYASLPDPWEHVPAPADGGIYWIDLQTGASRLVMSLDWAAQCAPRDNMDAAEHWFNHLTFSPDGRRFVFLHRWKLPDQRQWTTRLYTARPDGRDSRLLLDTGKVSHYTWRDPHTLLAWARLPDGGESYALIDDRTGQWQAVAADVLTCDGHMTYSPDGRWILTDTYPDGLQMRTLLLYEPTAGKRIDLGRFFSPRDLPVECRCDLHPRFSRDGRQVCIDSLHEGFRGMYVLDVSALTAS